MSYLHLELGFPGGHHTFGNQISDLKHYGFEIGLQNTVVQFVLCLENLSFCWTEREDSLQAIQCTSNSTIHLLWYIYAKQWNSKLLLNLLTLELLVIVHYAVC